MKSLYNDYFVGKRQVQTFLINLVQNPSIDTNGMYARAPQIARYVGNYCSKFMGTVEYSPRVVYGVTSALDNEEGGSLYKLIQCAGGKRQVVRGQNTPIQVTHVAPRQYNGRGQNPNHRFQRPMQVRA
jgi:hypothetical protein